MTALWQRPNYTSGGNAAAIALIALSSARLPDPLPVSRKSHGMPEDGEGPASVELVVRDRADDPTWFAEHVLAPFTELIAADLGPEAAAAALAAEHAYVIESTLDDPDDLGHVQAAWALAKCICEEVARSESAAVVIDVYAARAHLGSEVAALEPDRAFDILHEVTLFFDEQADGSLAAWSLGLRKFGRPDIVVLDIAPDDATDTALVLRDVAATLASGERIEPGDMVEVPAGSGGTARTLVAAAFDPASSSIVAVEGDALLLRAT